MSAEERERWGEPPAYAPGWSPDELAAAEQSAAGLGAGTAQQITTAQAEAGMPADRIAAHHEELAAGLLSDAETEEGQAFARAYTDTAAALTAELAELEAGS